VFTVVVAAGAAGAWIYARARARPAISAAAVVAQEQTTIEEAKRLCATGNCEAAHTKLERTIPEPSRWRDTQDFKDVESQWAQVLLDQADASPDVAAKRSLYQRVAQTMGVDAPRRKAAADRLQQLDSSATAVPANALELQAAVGAATAPAKTHSEDGAPPGPRGESARKSPLGGESPVAGGPNTVSPTSVEDRERQLALQGTTEAKVALKQQLESRVYGGRASDAEIRLLISTCKDLGDRSCVQQARGMLVRGNGAGLP
jgi:hypothetical protein